MYNKGHPYPGYPGYIMMNMNNDSYMTNGSLSPPMPRTVSLATSQSQFALSLSPSKVHIVLQWQHTLFLLIML